MNPLLICVAAATFGFQVGWERLPEGGMEYIIQLDPAAIDALRDGQTLHSAIPADAGEIRAYRIVMGTAEQAAARDAAAETRAAAVRRSNPPCRARRQPSLPLTLTILGLFASLGANVFLGWIAWGFRRRCQNA